MSAKGGHPAGLTGRLLGRIGVLATTRPRLVLLIWLTAVIVLALAGRDVDRQAIVPQYYIEGTSSARAHEVALREFGGDNALIVMLRGPRPALERQGRRLAARLGEMPRVLVISPWSRGGTVDGLRPSPEVAALIVRVEAGVSDGFTGVLPPVRRQLDASVRDPVEASVAGFPVVIDSIRTSSAEAAIHGEMIAIPVLLVVLLFVFRSVVAALIPIVVGGAVVASARGVLSLGSAVADVDLLSLNVIGMLGLALGVDYSLLVVSRFREERRLRGDPGEVVRKTVRATAGTVIPAGCGLLLAMLAALLLLSGPFGTSVPIAAIVVTLLSMASAICVVPALLCLLGPNLERWQLPQRRRKAGAGSMHWSRRLASRPRAVAALCVLLLFAGGALALDTGMGSIGLLPPGDEGRRQQEDIRDALGPGWIAPIEVIMDGEGRPVTTPQRLRALADFQRRVERDPGVETMAGFAEIADGSERLAGFDEVLARQEYGLSRLSRGISRVQQGAGLAGEGIGKAAAGSRQLDTGLGLAGDGAEALSTGLRAVGDGSGQLIRGLGRVDEGGGRLAQGALAASGGAGKIAEALDEAAQRTGEITGSARLFKNAMRSGEERLDEVRGPLRATEAQLTLAWRALQRMSAGRADPEFAAVQAALEEAGLQLTGTDVRTGEQANPSFSGVGAGLERVGGQFSVGSYLASKLDREGRQASTGMDKLARASHRLDRGLDRLAAGSQRIATGLGKLAEGGEQLPPALLRIGAGAKRLTAGLGALQSGAGMLAGGLEGGAEKSGLLTGALEKIGSAVEEQSDPDGSGGSLQEVRRRSPGLFRSGYFVLAALDGARPEQRRRLGSLINLNRGGLNARMLVIPRAEHHDEEGEATIERLEGDAEALARQADAEAMVGGIGPFAREADDAFRDETPSLRLALSLLSFLILVPVMRSLTMPILSALINLLTVSASLGVLALLFNGSLLGGPGFVDTSVIPATILVIFALAIDYEVFVFARMREEYVRTGSPSAAVANGLERTAPVVSGAAMTMIAVFLAFSVSELMTVRNFGVAQAVAVFIDAFVVRLIVIPVLMDWLGRWAWWMPRWLDRLLPGGSIPVPAEGKTR